MYISDIPTGYWPIGVDQPRRNRAPRREEATDPIEDVSISSDSSADDGESLANCLPRMAAGKHPMAEGPSQKKKVTGPLCTGGSLVIHDVEENRK